MLTALHRLHALHVSFSPQGVRIFESDVAHCNLPVDVGAVKLPALHVHTPSQTLAHTPTTTKHRDGHAHWGMLQAAEWFAENELKNVSIVKILNICKFKPCAWNAAPAQLRTCGVLDKHSGYGLVLVGHRLPLFDTQYRTQVQTIHTN